VRECASVFVKRSLLLLRRSKPCYPTRNGGSWQGICGASS